MAKFDAHLKCSFCGKSQDQVRKLIAGPGVYICDECIDLCNEILDEELVDSQGNPRPGTEHSRKAAPAERKTSKPAPTLASIPKPLDIKNFLDQQVVGQNAAKKVMSVAVYNHYKRLAWQGDVQGETEETATRLHKSNILLIGPTGCGKTLLAQTLAEMLDVPFAVADATTLTEAGYVGEDVENILLRLLQKADMDVDQAQRGIIYIDEIDKIASSRGVHGPDVSRSGVQRNLLKLMEETDVDLKAPHDIASQMESVMQMQQTGKIDRQKVNTRNILFIVSGAFSGLNEIIGRRLNKGSMGFRANSDDTSELDQLEGDELLSHVRAEDLIEYGFESEFIGRLPVIAVLHGLSSADLSEILQNPKSDVILSKKRDFRAYGINVDFTEEALTLFAERAYEEHIGARGLVSAIEKVLLNYEKKLPSIEIEHFTVDADTVRAALEEEGGDLLPLPSSMFQ